MRELTITAARRLAEESYEVGNAKPVLPRHRGHANLEPPWHIRHMAALIVFGIGGTFFMALALVGLIVSGELSGNQISDVQAVVGLAEKIVDADLEKARLASEVEVSVIEKDDETSILDMILDILFWIIAVVIFYAVAWQYSEMWGLGVATLVAAIIVILVLIPGVLEIARLVVGN